VDGKNCELLKEVAIDSFAANPTSVISSTGREKINESAPIMKDLLQPVNLMRGTASDYASRLFAERSTRRAST
jgi:hypothetical protein